MIFSHLFCSELSVKITMGKGIGHIYKYDQQNYPYPSPNTTLVIPPRFDTSKQNQRNSDSDVFAGANDEVLDG